MSYSSTIYLSPAVAFEGMLATSEHVDVASKIAKASIKPARAVRIDTADNFDELSLPTSAAMVTGDATHVPPLGVTIGDVTQNTNPYAAGDPCPVLQEGEIWVRCEATVDPSLPVYIRHTANGGLDQVGGFSSAAGTGLALAPAGWRWMSTTTATAQLARLRVSLP